MKMCKCLLGILVAGVPFRTSICAGGAINFLTFSKAAVALVVVQKPETP